jgi:hypothetical protein
MLKENYMTGGELAGTLGIAMTQLYWLARSGKIPPGEKMGKERLYSRTEADAIAVWYAQYRAAKDGMAWQRSELNAEDARLGDER